MLKSGSVKEQSIKRLAVALPHRAMERGICDAHDTRQRVGASQCTEREAKSSLRLGSGEEEPRSTEWFIA